MARLQPLEWLVDEIVNFYMILLLVRRVARARAARGRAVPRALRGVARAPWGSVGSRGVAVLSALCALRVDCARRAG